MYSILDQENSVNDLDILFEESSCYEPKDLNSKWSKFKQYITRKCVIISEFRERKVYVETLNVVTVKHTLNKLCNRVFKSRNSGYKKFLSDEEKRFIYPVNLCKAVEDLCI